jgi:YfiH family protein
VFASQHRVIGAAGVVDVAFTDRRGGVSPVPFDSLDLGSGGPGGVVDRDANLRILADAVGVSALALMRQVHGADVEVVTSATQPPPMCDALVSADPDVALCVRVADCVPVVLADADAGVVGVAHAGRGGVAVSVVPSTVAAMRRLGAEAITGWVGPHVCGGCYEVPAQMRHEVATAVPAAFACTTWGTPALDLGAAVEAQLRQSGCSAVDASTCTRESPDLYSYRRDGPNAGRLAGVVVLRDSDHD